jgi:hypothetical protein
VADRPHAWCPPATLGVDPRDADILQLALIELGELITLGVPVAPSLYKQPHPTQKGLSRPCPDVFGLIDRGIETVASPLRRLLTPRGRRSLRYRQGLRPWRSNPVGRALLALWGDAEWIRRSGIHEGTAGGSQTRTVAMPMVFEYQIDLN